MSAFGDARRFFHAHAGWSHGAGETSEQGRARCARELAIAERDGTARGLVAQWEEDTDADTSWLDTEDYSQEDRDAARFWSCIVRHESGHVLASMHGIHEDTRDSASFRRYQREVRAELFQEALAQLAKAGAT